MKTMESVLRKEMYQLKRIVEEAGKRITAAPKGHLCIMRKRGNIEYYFKSENRSNGKANSNCGNRGCGNGVNVRYMKKNEKSLAEGIAQKDYDVRMIKKAEERIKAIDTFLEKYKKTELGRLYQEMNPYRKELISAPVISDEEYIKQWQAEEYEGKQFADDAQEIVTEKGERVRSKSEKIIADKLYALGIPYRYEYPLVLDGNIKMYPDFTVLRMPAREEVYLEHLGMMDDSNYVDTILYKFSTYEKNGIYLGVNLFVTYETSKRPLNTRTLDGLLKKLFCEE